MRRPGGVGRTAALAVAALGLMGLGAVARWQWPSHAPALDCAPEAVRLGPDGVATCGPGEVPTGAQALALGRKVDLNTATEEELALLPGVGPSLARRLVEAREDRGRFASWDEVDAVAGVGPAKLQTLRAAAELRPSAGGEPVW